MDSAPGSDLVFIEIAGTLDGVTVERHAPPDTALDLDPIGREDIIETVRWKWQDDADFGYRINPRTVVARPLESTIPAVPATAAAAPARRRQH